MSINVWDTLQLLLMLAPPLLLAITLHEVAHGWAALRCGDTTAQQMGRLSFNPLRHVDPMGTILVPALLWLVPKLLAIPGGFLFGWAKPVPVNYHRLRRPKRDMALVALAGPVSNLLMALGWVGIAWVGYHAQSILPPWLAQWLIAMGMVGIDVNIMLCVLNLLPIPPLDGSRVLVGLLPTPIGHMIARIEPFGLIILVLLLTSGWLNLMPMVTAIRRLLLTLFF